MCARLTRRKKERLKLSDERFSSEGIAATGLDLKLHYQHFGKERA